MKTNTLTVGLDVGDRRHTARVLDQAGDIVTEEALANSREVLTAFCARYPGAVFVMETGTHSPWVSRLLTALGHPVIVANARKLRAISSSQTKSDREDAQMCIARASVGREVQRVRLHQRIPCATQAGGARAREPVCTSANSPQHRQRRCHGGGSAVCSCTTITTARSVSTFNRRAREVTVIRLTRLRSLRAAASGTSCLALMPTALRPLTQKSVATGIRCVTLGVSLSRHAELHASRHPRS